MWLGVGHDVDGFLRWVERDLVRFTPPVQLGLTPLGLCHDGVDAGIVFELPEPVQVVSMDDFQEPCLVDSTPGILVEQVPESGSHVPEEHLVRSLAFHDHLSGSLLKPRPREIDKGRVNSFASEFPCQKPRKHPSSGQQL